MINASVFKVGETARERNATELSVPSIRRYLTAVLAGAMTFFLTACGDGDLPDYD